MVYSVKNIFNTRIESMYDSRSRKYVGFDQYGVRNAEHYNSLDWKSLVREFEKETLCRHRAQLFRRSTLERKRVAVRLVHQQIADCEYGEDFTDMVYYVKNIFNRKYDSVYDSRIGKYVGYDEYGVKNADHYNNQDWKMLLRKAEVDTLCRYNARQYRISTIDRKVPPTVKVRQTKHADYGERTMFECSVWSFYPQAINVSWLIDGVETVTDVSSTDVLPNEDWTFQLHSYLELILKRGERLTCRVEHSSLVKSLEVDFDTFSLDAKYIKLSVGSIFFCIGFTAAVGGAVYYWWKRRSGFSPVDGREQTSTSLSDL
ncbi:H-2 class II histocompatibility antigen, E-S beta chain-like isoform X1 [Cynoglossus semilaevis]|uniref:HLA class II histocompatibility antigen, DRB1-14 beta chain-like n=1 Tax=Cynoglossus semilaevis TaxID=244447 RepID=A0A3P8W336_CYNSE|nr:H-2 class II histocompatibility antigen, E-S beta chain-like isoform X1 [Cynoglossus semilaevis]